MAVNGAGQSATDFVAMFAARGSDHLWAPMPGSVLFAASVD